VTDCQCESFFKTLVDHEVTVELKNDISIRGTLKSVDQYLNIKLDDIQVVEELRYPHLVSCLALYLELDQLHLYIYHLTNLRIVLS
jgi:small nuclear ribonucleoprotein (snRNP)-like protein